MQTPIRWDTLLQLPLEGKLMRMQLSGKSRTVIEGCVDFVYPQLLEQVGFVRYSWELILTEVTMCWCNSSGQCKDTRIPHYRTAFMPDLSTNPLRSEEGTLTCRVHARSFSTVHFFESAPGPPLPARTFLRRG